MIKRCKNWLALEGRYLVWRTKAKYYVIYRSAGGAGFFSNYVWVLGHVIFARKFGYIPVVDMKHYPTLYSEEQPVNGITNAWNYYFEDVSEISLQEVYKKGNYVLGKDMPLHKYAEKYCEPEYRFPTPRMVSYYAPYIERYLKVKKDLQEEFDADWKRKAVSSGQVLGIHIRGTDMKNDLGHPMPADAQTYLQKVIEFLKTHSDINKIFLATDENDIKEVFENAFRDTAYTLFMNEAFRVWDTDAKRKTGLHELKIENARPLHKYLLGKEVLQDAWFLHKCDYLICGHSNITNVAILWNGNRYKEIVCVG